LISKGQGAKIEDCRLKIDDCKTTKA